MYTFANTTTITTQSKTNVNRTIQSNSQTKHSNGRVLINTYYYIQFRLVTMYQLVPNIALIAFHRLNQLSIINTTNNIITFLSLQLITLYKAVEWK